MGTPKAPHSLSDVADVSVRPARPTDARLIADLQLEIWRADYADLLPAGALEALSPIEAAEQWAAAIAGPPTPAHAVLVALEGNELVGFAATAPSTDPDFEAGAAGELLILLVSAAHRRSGHGSRLMAAAMTGLQDAGRTAATAWLLVGDLVLREFLEGAGWALDGAQRELAADEPVKQVRLHTDLAEP
jgi:GNAT superfamily N-acetyltransferase